VKRILRGKDKDPVRMREDLNRIQTQFDDLISQMGMFKITLAKIAQGDDDFNVNVYKNVPEDYSAPQE
jgi:hypothetical protein